MGSISTDRVSFASITPNNLGTVRKLNSVLFPIAYSEKFYQDIQSAELEDFCKLIYFNDIPVGTVCCRIETKDGVNSLYLMTMGVLAPYRNRGLGEQSIQVVTDAGSAYTKKKIQRIYLHVQSSNDDAKRFYQRHGFEEVQLVKDYYKRLQPRDAWMLQRKIDRPS